MVSVSKRRTDPLVTVVDSPWAVTRTALDDFCGRCDRFKRHPSMDSLHAEPIYMKVTARSRSPRATVPHLPMIFQRARLRD
jgi:hypothetical protein